MYRIWPLLIVSIGMKIFILTFNCIGLDQYTRFFCVTPNISRYIIIIIINLLWMYCIGLEFSPIKLAFYWDLLYWYWIKCLLPCITCMVYYFTTYIGLNLSYIIHIWLDLFYIICFRLAYNFCIGLDISPHMILS